MAEKLRVAATHEVEEGRGLLVDVRGQRLALFLYKGRYFAVEDACPHRGASLHEGRVEQGIVICPWHEWRFDIRTGLCPVNPLSKIRTYPIHVEDGEIFVELDG